MLPTLLAIAGDPDVNKKLLNGHKVGDKTFKVHIDGFNMLPYLTGEVKESPRELVLLHERRRRGRWRSGSATGSWCSANRRPTQMRVWTEPFVKLRVPLIFNLRRDPFERAEYNSNTYYDWMVDHALPAVRDAGAGGGADRRTSRSSRRARSRRRSTSTR